MNDKLEHILAGRDLDEHEAEALLAALALEDTSPAVAGALLAALRAKGESAAELRGFARGMRRLARKPVLRVDGPFVDTCGTGGDGSSSVNLSTGAALLAAACDAKVVKHGNRAVSGRTGSADVLEALGLRLPLEEEAAESLLEATGFTFLFAPHYHPAMKAIMPVRRALGVRTVFNMLGPLTNPAEPDFQLIGAYSAEAAERMAHALSGLTLKRAFVVHGAAGWDEPTPLGPFVLYDVTPGLVKRETRDPRDLGIPRCAAADLAGGDAAHNAARLTSALCSHGTAEDVTPADRALRDALVLGAALVLELTGLTAVDAVHAAEAAIDNGRARAVLETLARFGAGRFRTGERTTS